MNKTIFSFLCCFAMTGTAFAGTAVSASIAKAWMANTGSWSACGLNSTQSGALKSVGAALYKGDVYWIAWELNENGGRFCPTQVGAGRDSGKSGWTAYYNISSNTDCIWLCKNGKGGNKCNSSVTEVSGESPIMKSTTSANADGVNRENSIAMLVANDYRKCRDSAKPWHAKNTQEHDVVLAVTGYTDDGYGAYVQPLVVRAATKPVWNYWSDYGKGYPLAYLANSADKTLVCMNGYKHNSTGKGCVKYTAAQVAKEEAIKKTKAAQEKACSGWTISSTDEFINTFKVVEVGGCNQYRCKNSSMGFKGDTDRTCTACNADDRHGVNPETGVCTECTEKQTFSSTAKDTGYCRDKTMLTPSHLQYGVKNTQSLKLEQQCWYILHKEGFDKYKECIVAETHDEKK